MSRTVKARLVLGIGERVIERPRELQHAAGTDEHHVVHALYTLQKDGYVAFKKRKALHAPGINLTAIRLTPRGIKYYKDLTRDQS